MKCLNEKCNNEVDDKKNVLWCSLTCKEAFLVDKYSEGQCSRSFAESKVQTEPKR